MMIHYILMAHCIVIILMVILCSDGAPIFASSKNSIWNFTWELTSYLMNFKINQKTNLLIYFLILKLKNRPDFILNRWASRWILCSRILLNKLMKFLSNDIIKNLGIVLETSSIKQYFMVLKAGLVYISETKNYFIKFKNKLV